MVETLRRWRGTSWLALHVRWEVYEHFDAPNGTEGALRSQAQFAAFVNELHGSGEVWTYVSLASRRARQGCLTRRCTASR